jgi:hypothetical protein
LIVAALVRLRKTDRSIWFIRGHALRHLLVNIDESRFIVISIGGRGRIASGRVVVHKRAVQDLQVLG